jgi:hypothetical protein
VKSHYAAVHGQYSGNGFKSVSIIVPGSKKVQRFQICVGNHPDDIQRWIAERRKRFPRQSSRHQVEVEQQQQQQEQQQQQQSVTAKTTNSSSESEINPIENKSALLGSLLSGYGSSSDGESDGNDCAEAINKRKKSNEMPENGTAIVCPVRPDGGNQQQQVTSQPQQHRSRLCRYFAKNGQCRNGNNCSFSHEQSSSKHSNLDNQPTTKKQRLHPNKTATKTTSGITTAPPPSLLHKLLANDIQREASLTLQLLEYLVKSNFLQQTEDEN